MFDGYSGLVEPLVPDTTELLAESGAVISSEVVTADEGTEPLRGDFTLSFRGQHTPALSYNSTADEASAADFGAFHRPAGRWTKSDLSFPWIPSPVFSVRVFVFSKGTRDTACYGKCLETIRQG